jgi:hypothetical protein
MTINTDHKTSLMSQLAKWWRSRRKQRADTSDYVRAAADSESVGRPASEPTPRVVAGKWPGTDNPLGQKLEQLRHGGFI